MFLLLKHAQSMLETALSGLDNTISWKVVVLVGFSPNLQQWCIMGQR